MSLELISLRLLRWLQWQRAERWRSEQMIDVMTEENKNMTKPQKNE